jgi:hypothetical protein
MGSLSSRVHPSKLIVAVWKTKQILAIHLREQSCEQLEMTMAR